MRLLRQQAYMTDREACIIMRGESGIVQVFWLGMSSSRSSDRLDPGASERSCAQAFPNSPMPGTAEVVDVWILLEERGSWPARAVTDGVLPSALRDWLDAQVAAFARAGLAARPQLIRQETRDSGGRRLLVAFGGSLYACAGLPDLQIQALALPALLPELAAAAAAPPLPWQSITEPHYFVCTNGRRDQCCARLGLPVYRRLRALVQDRAWRTTHVGGHRFAPNVLTLADGAVYGRVAAADCEMLVAAVDRAELDFARLRGRSSYPQAVQAAEALLAEQHVKLLHVDGDERNATVTFAGANGRHQITVRRSAAPQMILAGCDKSALKAVYPFERVPTPG